MWTVRNNLKGALKFTDIFIGGKQIILKSRGFLDLDLIDGGRAAADMSEQVKRCYDENYIKDIFKTQTPEEKVQMNLRDLEAMAQRSELEDLKGRLQDGGMKMDEILAALNQSQPSTGGSEELNSLKQDLQAMIEQIQMVTNSSSTDQLKDGLNEIIHDIRDLKQGRFQATVPKNENEMRQQQFQSLFETQDQKIEALMEMLKLKQKNIEPIKQEHEFDFEQDYEPFEVPDQELARAQIKELQELKQMLKAKESSLSKESELETQMKAQKQQLDELMLLLKDKQERQSTPFAVSPEEQRQILKNQLLHQRQIEQIAQMLEQKQQPEIQVDLELKKKLEAQQEQLGGYQIFCVNSQPLSF